MTGHRCPTALDLYCRRCDARAGDWCRRVGLAVEGSEIVLLVDDGHVLHAERLDDYAEEFGVPTP